jgi:hypothetical protein
MGKDPLSNRFPSSSTDFQPNNQLKKNKDKAKEINMKPRNCDTVMKKSERKTSFGVGVPKKSEEVKECNTVKTHVKRLKTGKSETNHDKRLMQGRNNQLGASCKSLDPKEENTGNDYGKTKEERNV